MAIEPALNPNMPISSPFEDEEEDLSIEIVNPESVVLETEDGGMMIDFNPGAPGDMQASFDENLADFMGDQELRALASELTHLAKSDKESM